MADFDFDFNNLPPLQRSSPIRRRLDEEELPAGSFGEGRFAWQYPALRSTAQNLAQQRIWQDPQPFAPPNRISQLNEELSMNVQRHFGGFAETSNPPPSSQRSLDIMSVAATTNQDSISEILPPTAGYMDRSSAFRLESNPTQLSFLDWYPSGDGTLTFQNDDMELQSVHNVNIEIIRERSAVLAMAFEPSRSGPRLYLETLTSATALPFLRFLYSGTYALNGANEDLYEDVSTSVLFHCQLYHLGDIYDLPELKSQAYVNVLRQCEFGCSSPDKPIDLCAAIRYIYEHLRTHENLVDAVINYCVSCFLGHKLAEDDEFKQLAYELRPFHQALCKNSMYREFENETASAIIQMPFKSFSPETYASREDSAAKRLEDVVFHFHANDEIDCAPKKRKRQVVAGPSNEKATIIPLRPSRSSIDAAFEDGKGAEVIQASSSKRRASTTARSPEPVPIQLVDADQVSLPLRHRSNNARDAIDGSDSEDDYFKVTREDTASPASPASPAAGFEVVENIGAIEQASHDDSDSETLVEITQEEAESPSTRTSGVAANAANADAAESDSESEWTLI